jgi:hypothetical protein
MGREHRAKGKKNRPYTSVLAELEDNFLWERHLAAKIVAGSHSHKKIRFVMI